MIATGLRLAFPTEYEKFTESQAWLLIEDEARGHFQDRWQKAEVIVETKGVMYWGADDFFTVASQGATQTTYKSILNRQPDEPGCTCPDWSKSLTNKGAPHGWCKHRLAAWLFRERSTQQRNTPIIQQPGEVNTMNEARASWNVRFNFRGFDEQLTLRGDDEHEVLARAKVVLVNLLKQQETINQPTPSANGKPGELRSPKPNASVAPANPSATETRPSPAEKELRRINPDAPLCPECSHTAIWLEGVSKNTGKPYSFWKCEFCQKPLPRQKKAA